MGKSKDKAMRYKRVAFILLNLYHACRLALEKSSSEKFFE